MPWILLMFFRSSRKVIYLFTAWKVSRYGGFFSGPFFLAYGLNTERYGAISLRIQSEYGKIRTRKNSVFGHFSHSECANREAVSVKLFMVSSLSFPSCLYVSNLLVIKSTTSLSSYRWLPPLICFSFSSLVSSKICVVCFSIFLCSSIILWHTLQVLQTLSKQFIRNITWRTCN